MNLTIDIGNSRTSIGLFQGDALAFRADYVTDAQGGAVALEACLRSFAAQAQTALGELPAVTAAAAACVVSGLGEACQAAVRSTYGVSPVMCSAFTAGALFDADYPQPSEIGADRVADAIAVRAFYGAPAVVVDFGTATNIEVINRDGAFLGGIIAPGLETSMDALFSHASKVKRVEVDEPPAAIGVSTRGAVLSGIVYGEADRADGLVRRIFAQLGYRAQVIATGGLAGFVARYSAEITQVDADLTLRGLNLLCGGAR